MQLLLMCTPQDQQLLSVPISAPLIILVLSIRGLVSKETVVLRR